MTQVEAAKSAIRNTLDQVKEHLAQEAPHKLSEADTKANFIEPIVVALGWQGIGIVTREYYVKNSQEFIDYVLRGASGPLLAIEAKALQADLSDKNAAQLIQYCSVEGIEWAALTNGRELQFFNAYLRGDLDAKRIFRLDLLAFNTDAEFDALFDLLWQLSRESMTTPEGVHRWLNRRRMDAAVRAAVLDANSAAVRAIRRALADVDIKATPQDVAQWFASRLNTDATPVPAAESLALLPAARRKPPRAEPRSGADKRDEVADESSSDMPKQHVIRLSDLIQAGILAPNTELLLLKGSQIRATASVNADGSIMYSGHNYRTPSNKEFARLLGWPSINGWDRWHVEFPEGRVSLSDLRTRLNPDSSLG